jgi:putative SbcD/Mre11-related phosphoesterase
MQILPNIEIRDLGLFLIKEKTLILSDLHIGYEDSLNRAGILVPKVYFKEFLERLKLMLNGVDQVIINGDFHHEFSKFTYHDRDSSDQLLKIIGKRKLIVIEGNHDPLVKFVLNLDIRKFYKIREILICHGDEIINEDCKVIIIGHEHASVGLKEDVRLEKYKAFLVGKFEKKTLIVMPSCNLATEGSDLIRDRKLSPYLQGSLDNFKVYLLSDKVYDFGKLKNLK